MNVMLGERVKKPKKEESKGREQKEKEMKLQLKAVETKQSRHSESVCRVHPARYRHDGHYTLAVGAQCGIDVRYGMRLSRIIHFPGYQLLRSVLISSAFNLVDFLNQVENSGSPGGFLELEG